MRHFRESYYRHFGLTLEESSLRLKANLTPPLQSTA
jgi:hypothetical protein